MEKVQKSSILFSSIFNLGIGFVFMLAFMACSNQKIIEAKNPPALATKVTVQKFIPGVEGQPPYWVVKFSFNTAAGTPNRVIYNGAQGEVAPISKNMFTGTLRIMPTLTADPDFDLVVIKYAHDSTTSTVKVSDFTVLETVYQP